MEGWGVCGEPFGCAMLGGGFEVNVNSSHRARQTLGDFASWWRFDVIWSEFVEYLRLVNFRDVII